METKRDIVIRFACPFLFRAWGCKLRVKSLEAPALQGRGAVTDTMKAVIDGN